MSTPGQDAILQLIHNYSERAGRLLTLMEKEDDPAEYMNLRWEARVLNGLTEDLWQAIRKAGEAARQGTVKITLELAAADGSDAAQLWQEMNEDVERDPAHLMTLQTRSYCADVKPA